MPCLSTLILTVCLAWISPLTSRRLVPTVPYESLDQTHATCMPDTIYPIIRLPVDLSWSSDSGSSFDIFPTSFDTFISGLLTFVFLILTCRFFLSTFPQRSRPLLLITAAWGSLKPIPENRFRRAYLHLS